MLNTSKQVPSGFTTALHHLNDLEAEAPHLFLSHCIEQTLRNYQMPPWTKQTRSTSHINIASANI
jgi:hypothetical protein